jgi:hypothetical protein
VWYAHTSVDHISTQHVAATPRGRAKKNFSWLPMEYWLI